MERFNFLDTLLIKTGIKKPRTFKKEARKQIKENTLNYLKTYGRSRWINVGEIFEETLEKTDLYNSKEGIVFFAEDGIKSKINQATHSLKREGHPIVSATKRKGKYGKGYRYADEKCDDFIDRWDEAYRAIDQRKMHTLKEKQWVDGTVKKLIQKLIEQGRKEEAKELEKVLVKYEEKQKEEES